MSTSFATLGFFSGIGWPEMLVIGVIMLLLFGGRLPEVGKSLGRGIVEFKKGLKSVNDDVEQASEPNQYRQQLPNQGGPQVQAPSQGQTVSRGDAQPSA